MFSDQFIAMWAERLQREIPDATAVLLKGSAARGAAGSHSDLDFDVLTAVAPREEYLAWFEDIGGGTLRHISVAVQDVDGWLGEADEPVSWAYGLPAAETTRLLWASDAALRDALDQPARLHPPEEPELEDFIEAWGKVRNARRKQDDLAMRLAAEKLARTCTTLLRPVNPEVWPSNRREAMEAALSFSICPDGYREDILQCFGLSPEPAGMDSLLDAARRLTFGTIGLIRDHADTIGPMLPEDLFQALMDGRIDRYIRQE
jgi:phosphoribosyl-AMP cyclohydrolase